MSEHADREVAGHPDWKLTPKAWSDGKAVGYELTGAGLRQGELETVQIVDGADTVTLTWWEQARLYYRSVK